MIRFLLLISLLVAPLTLLAKESSPHKSLKTPDQALPWQAVGRLDLGNGYCTGALISPKLVLTAAHCIYDSRKGKIRPARTITFKAGYRHGRAVATRTAKRVIWDSDYQFEANNTLRTISSDVAVIELESPIINAAVIPFERHRSPTRSERVMVVSYGRGRSEVPALEDGCKMLGLRRDVLHYDCDIISGSSGSPVFVITDAGPKIASVMSSTGKRNGEKISLGVSLGARVDRLVRQLETTNVESRFVKVSNQTLPNARPILKRRGLPQIKRPVAIAPGS